MGESDPLYVDPFSPRAGGWPAAPRVLIRRWNMAHRLEPSNSAKWPGYAQLCWLPLIWCSAAHQKERRSHQLKRNIVLYLLVQRRGCIGADSWKLKFWFIQRLSNLLLDSQPTLCLAANYSYSSSINTFIRLFIYSSSEFTRTGPY